MRGAQTAKKVGFVLLTLTLVPTFGFAQKPIEDNSFLVEEAYNQEKGVIQYINSFSRERNGNWLYTFTNEIPVKSQRHQFSYSLNVSHIKGTTRLGDTFLNYRFQAAGLGEKDRVAVAPRVSVILPTGSYRRETGSGSVGVQVNIPVSVTHSSKLVTHWNVGTTLIPRARNPAGDRANIKAANLGQSTVFLLKPKVNVLVETVWYYNPSVAAPGRTDGNYSMLINPGLRWAWDLKSGWQIVPGIGVPIGVGPSKGEYATFLYLSFEK